MTPAHTGGVVSLVVAVGAGAALLVAGPAAKPAAAPAGRIDAAKAWPHAKRADLDPALPDGPLLTPLLFLDPATVLGTAPTPDARWVRLLLKDGRGLRELRRLPLGSNPQFEAVTAAGDDLVWTESADGGGRVRIWHAGRAGGPARLLTADTGDALFYGTEFDLAIAGGRVHWAAASRTPKSTDIRSVPLTGGAVSVRTEPGEWAMSAWPWLVDDQDRRLRNLETRRDTDVAAGGPVITTCAPVWCLVVGTSQDGPARIDLVHPDGTGRRRIAGGTARSAVTEVAVLDRFELLSEPGPNSDLTGRETLLAYDVATSRTVTVAADVDGAFTGGGMLWWSTGDDDNVTWHALDLRTA